MENKDLYLIFPKLLSTSLTESNDKRQYEFGIPSTLGTTLKKANSKIKADITPASPYPINVYEKTRLPKF